VAGSLSPWPLGWIAATPKLPDLLFFVRQNVTGGGQWVAALAVGGGIWRRLGWIFIWMVGCFIFILSFCIFVKMLMCHLVIGGQKTHCFCNDRIAAPLFC
jgi:hypothetical protein